jgi:hypothetical protein
LMWINIVPNDVQKDKKVKLSKENYLICKEL